MKFTLPVAQPFEQDTLDDAQFSFGASLSLLPATARFVRLVGEVEPIG
jgi:hypothetical protein